MRQDWVDIVKAITMISVVMGHISYQYPQIPLLPIPMIIAGLWHVPVFFIVGGFFIKDEKLLNPKTFLSEKIKKLYCPIIFIYIPVVLMHNWFIDIGFYDTSKLCGGKKIFYWEAIDFIKKIGEAIFLAGREPVLGAMWFAYVLFMALCYICFISFIIKKLTNESSPKNEYYKALVLLIGVVISSFLTEVFDFTIPRFNNVFTAAWLIYVGKLLNQKFKVKFNNKYILLCSVIVFYSYVVLHGGIQLNKNDFGDTGTLTLSACSALYIVAYVAKKLKRGVARIFVWIGKDSFYIMAFQFIAFKICSIILNMFGGDYSPALLEAPAANIFLYIYYAVGGVFLPLFFIHFWRICKNFILTKIK